MDDNSALIVSTYLDNTSTFHCLNYYYQQQLNNTGDEDYVYRLECLCEWWELEQREQLYDMAFDDQYNNLIEL